MKQQATQIITFREENDRLKEREDKLEATVAVLQKKKKEC